MKLITDRTKEDVLLGKEKGRYEAADLNRVETAVQYLSFVLQSIISAEQLPTKTDWGAPGPFSSDTWPTTRQMDRYLNNVKSLCSSVGISADLPESMEDLNWQGANQIEAALSQVLEYVRSNYKGFQYSGDLFAGEENGL